MRYSSTVYSFGVSSIGSPPRVTVRVFLSSERSATLSTGAAIVGVRRLSASTRASSSSKANGLVT